MNTIEAARIRYDVLVQIHRGHWAPLPFEELRCHQCEDATECPSAFDDYNTDGDCLEEK